MHCKFTENKEHLCTTHTFAHLKTKFSYTTYFFWSVCNFEHSSAISQGQFKSAFVGIGRSAVLHMVA